MDKNTITGFVLMALVLFGFAWWQTPSDEEIAQERVEFVKDQSKSKKLLKQQIKQTQLIQIQLLYSIQQQKVLQKILYCKIQK